MNLHYDKQPCNTIDAASSMYGGREFLSPTRSTVPLLSWLKHEQPMVRSVLRDMGMAGDFDQHLEYQVRPPKGNGIASHTDLMIISDEFSLAIEAKWTEPRYKTVSEWIKEGSNPPNRCDVLTGWLGLLQRHAQRTLQVTDFSDAVYQMVHRAASACAAGGHPRMAYLVFEPSPDPKTADIPALLDDLAHLWNLLDRPDGFPLFLIEMHLSPTPAFDVIAKLSKGNEATGKAVQDALCNERLFNFSEYVLRTVNGGCA